MPTYKAEPGTEVQSADAQGNVWDKPIVFPKSGSLTVPDDQQDVVSALDSAAGAGAIQKVTTRSRKADPNAKEE